LYFITFFVIVKEAFRENRKRLNLKCELDGITGIYMNYAPLHKTLKLQNTISRQILGDFSQTHSKRSNFQFFLVFNICVTVDITCMVNFFL